MADEDNVLTAADTPLESGERAAEAEPARTYMPPPKKRRSMAWVGYLILLIVLLIAAGAWFLLQELRSRQDGIGGQLSTKDQQIVELTHQVSGVQSQLSALQSQLATIQGQVANEDSRFERMLGETSSQLGERLESTRSDLGGSITSIQKQLNHSRGDLLIADAEYLLGIANQKLHLVGDVKAVLAAMEAADQRLHDSGDPGVFKVREALAEEIDALKKINAPDVVGLSAQLLLLEKKAKALPLFLPHAGKSSESGAKPHGESEPGKTGENEDKSPLEDLKGLVTIRRSDRPVAAILEPEQVYALREVLLLKLETTRSALLRGDDELFQSGLGSARDWVKENFDLEAPGTKELLGELEALTARSVHVPYPDISKSLNLLRNIEKLRLEAEQSTVHSKPAPKKEAEPPAQPSGESGASMSPTPEPPAGAQQ